MDGQLNCPACGQPVVDDVAQWQVQKKVASPTMPGRSQISHMQAVQESRPVLRCTNEECPVKVAIVDKFSWPVAAGMVEYLPEKCPAGHADGWGLRQCAGERRRIRRQHPQRRRQRAVDRGRSDGPESHGDRLAAVRYDRQ